MIYRKRCGKLDSINGTENRTTKQNNTDWLDESTNEIRFRVTNKSEMLSHVGKSDKFTPSGNLVRLKCDAVWHV